MDLEHPAISRTLKEGYPDGAGKPQQKNTNPFYYNRVEEDEQMDDLINDLLEIKNSVDVEEFLSIEIDVIDEKVKILLNDYKVMTNHFDINKAAIRTSDEGFIRLTSKESDDLEVNCYINHSELEACTKEFGGIMNE